MACSIAPAAAAIPFVAGTMTWSFTGFHATIRYITISATKNLMRKSFWSRFMEEATVYSSASDDRPLHRAPRQSARSLDFARADTGAIRRDAAVDSDLVPLAMRSRAPRHRRVHAARPLHVAARLRARGPRDAARERCVVPNPDHVAR